MTARVELSAARDHVVVAKHHLSAVEAVVGETERGVCGEIITATLEQLRATLATMTALDRALQIVEQEEERG